MLGNGAYFGAFLGETPAPCVCDDTHELAEWFRLFAAALRVSRMRRTQVIDIVLRGAIDRVNTTVRVFVDPLEFDAHKGRTTPNVRR